MISHRHSRREKFPPLLTQATLWGYYTCDHLTDADTRVEAIISCTTSLVPFNSEAEGARYHLPVSCSVAVSSRTQQMSWPQITTQIPSIRHHPPLLGSRTSVRCKPMKLRGVCEFVELKTPPETLIRIPFHCGCHSVLKPCRIYRLLRK